MSHKYKEFAIITLMVLSLLSGCDSKRSSHTIQANSHIDTTTPTDTSIPTDLSQSSINETSLQPSAPISRIPNESQVESERNSSDDEHIDTLMNDLYIGEVFNSGLVYMEPFPVDRFPFYEAYSFHDYSDRIKFYTIDGSNEVYESTFDSESSDYIPSLEDSQYFWQASAGESEQYTLCYKIDGEAKASSVGIGFMSHEIHSIDFSNMGEKRIYSETEYNNAVAEVTKSVQTWKELGGTLRERTIVESIIGAQQICLINVKDSNYKLLLSKYLYLGFESTADVYVLDFLDEEGNVIKTLEKSNGAWF